MQSVVSHNSSDRALILVKCEGTQSLSVASSLHTPYNTLTDVALPQVQKCNRRHPSWSGRRSNREEGVKEGGGIVTNMSTVTSIPSAQKFFSRGGHSIQSFLTTVRFIPVDPADGPRQMLFDPHEKYFAVVWCATIQSSGHYKAGVILHNTHKTNPNRNTWSNKAEIRELILNKTSGFDLSLLECYGLYSQGAGVVYLTCIMSTWQAHLYSKLSWAQRVNRHLYSQGVGADIQHTPALAIALPRPCSAPFSSTLVSVYHAFEYSTGCPVQRTYYTWHFSLGSSLHNALLAPLIVKLLTMPSAIYHDIWYNYW